MLTFSLCSCILFLSSVSNFMTITWNSLSDKLPIFVSFSSFSEVLSYSFIWKVFLCLFTCLFCVVVLFSYVLGISAASPVHEEVKCPMGPRLQFRLAPRARCSRAIPCVSFVWPASVGGPQSLLAPSTFNNPVSLQSLLLTCSIMLHMAVINQVML